MWSQSVSVFDPYAAIVDASKKKSVIDEQKTEENKK